MSRTPPSPTALRVAELSQNAQTPFSLRPDADSLRMIAEELGRSDWELEARLGATVVQPCVVTLEPVQTRIDVDVTRLFVQDYEEPEEAEVEMPEDDRTEPLGAWIDPAAIMIEALALEIPEYPRADGAELGQAVYTKPGDTPMTDEDARPFAGLAGLKNQLKDDTTE